jgi:hypothetical protein
MTHSHPKRAACVALATLTGAVAAAAALPHGPLPGGAAGPETASAASPSALKAAVAVVRSKGYTPDDVRQYKTWATLRVLVATATGSASGNNQQAFFFVGRRYIGTATSSPSASLAYVGQTATRVRLEYGVFGPGSGDCCPTGHRIVRFQWNGKRLVPLDPIP